MHLNGVSGKIQTVQLVHLYISPGHNYFGHTAKLPGNHRVIEVAALDCVAGHGIRGDRFFDYKENYKGQLTFFELEVFQALADALGVYDTPPSVLRRNVVTEGQELARLIGTEFEVEGVRFAGVEECRPCFWMDQAFAPGAEKFLRGRGGLRARILSDGTLRVKRAVPA